MVTCFILLVSLLQSTGAFYMQSCRHPTCKLRAPTKTASIEETRDDVDVGESDELQYDPMLDESVAGKFTIRTCASTSCSKRRRELHLDEFATYTDFYVRYQERAPSVSVAESSCLGSCRHGPCVAIEHDDYDGPVGVEGMTPEEFSKRVFVHVDYADRVDRVWSCFENAVLVMAAASPSCDHEDDLLVPVSSLASDMRSV